MHEAIARHPATAAFQRRVIIRTEFNLELIKLVLRNAVFLDVTNHRIKFRECCFAGIFWLVQYLRDHLRWAVVTKYVVDATIDFDRHLLFDDEVAIRAAGASSVEGLVEQGHGVPLTGAAPWDRVTDRHGWQRAEFLFDLAAALLRLLRLAGIGKWRRGSGGDISEVFLGQRETFLGFYIAEDQEHGVVRRVVRFKEGLHVGKAGGIEVGKVAVEIVSVGPVSKGNGREIEPGKPAIRLVQNTDAYFFLHDVALVAKIFVIDFQGAHAIGFEPKNALEGVGGHGLEVVGHVVMRGTVKRAATRIDELDMLHLGCVSRALEHHVLEEMGEAAPALRLKPETDFVVDAHGDNRGRCVWRNNYFESIGECGRLDGYLHYGSSLNRAKSDVVFMQCLG